MFAVDFSPRRWDLVKYQDNTVNTLKSMISNNKEPKSVLFIGKTGTGKTTIAKIYAASLVCKNLEEGNPCGKCDNCLDIFNDIFSRSVRYINGVIDSGIDFYRKELENLIGFSSFFSDRKVIIIDEVHGLSKESLQSFLLPTESKVIKDVYFIFATTEGKQVKETLSTRCIDFKLNQPSELDIANLLALKISELKIRLPKDFIAECCYEIACYSNGSIRSAYNTLEKVINSKIYDINKVIELFNSTEETNIFSFVKNYLEGDFQTAIIELINNFKENDIYQDFVNIMQYLIDYKLYVILKIPCKRVHYFNKLKSIKANARCDDIIKSLTNAYEKLDKFTMNKHYLINIFLEGWSKCIK